MLSQHYSPDEANAILNNAVRDKPLPGDMTREQLLALASEMGITPTALSEAERKWRAEQEIEALRPRFRADRKWRLSVLLIVSVFCVLVPILSGDATAQDVLIVASTFLMIFLIALTRLAFGGEDEAFQRWLDRRGRRAIRASGRMERRLRGL